jgi:hypothetical protein
MRWWRIEPRVEPSCRPAQGNRLRLKFRRSSPAIQLAPSQPSQRVSWKPRARPPREGTASPHPTISIGVAPRRDAGLRKTKGLSPSVVWEQPTFGLITRRSRVQIPPPPPSKARPRGRFYRPSTVELSVVTRRSSVARLTYDGYREWGTSGFRRSGRLSAAVTSLEACP